MYAIITDGGRQYRVEEGQTLEVDYRNSPIGSELKFEQVLVLNDGDKLHFGKPHVSGASVSAAVVGPVLGPKLVIQWFRRRKNSKRRNGHRQLMTKVRISSIKAS